MNSGFFLYSVVVRSVERVLGQFGDVIVSGEDIEQEGPGFGPLVQSIKNCYKILMWSDVHAKSKSYQKMYEFRILFVFSICQIR